MIIIIKIQSSKIQILKKIQRNVYLILKNQKIPISLLINKMINKLKSNNNIKLLHLQVNNQKMMLNMIKIKSFKKIKIQSPQSLNKIKI